MLKFWWVIENSVSHGLWNHMWGGVT
jgi:hypothetical protein